ncbi:MAG: hypothetical protein KAX67_03025, partial [Pararheinheimera sp.]|nr:hypothetical protein [Rheinheimera sp.]
TNLCGDWNSELFAIEVDPENNDSIINAIFQNGQQLLRNKFKLVLSTCAPDYAFCRKDPVETYDISTLCFYFTPLKAQITATTSALCNQFTVLAKFSGKPCKLNSTTYKSIFFIYLSPKA